MEKNKKWNNKGWGYDTDFYRKSSWIKLKKKHIQDNPLCELHLNYHMVEGADVVDHIIPRRVTKEYELDEDNLQSLCHDCHNKKIGIEKDIGDLNMFIKELDEGKLQYVCVEEKKKILLEKIRGN